MVRMDVTSVIIATAVGVTAIMSSLAVEHCKVFSVSNPYSGRYCPGDGMVTLHMLPRQCGYACLASPTCKAFNYNSTEGSCTRFTSPCLQAIPHTMMKFAVFTEKTKDQCYEWVPYGSGDAVDPRMISADTEGYRIICRMQRDGDDRVGYFFPGQSICYGSWESSEFNSNQGYPSQRLRIMEGCTVSWVPYTAEHPINPRSVIGGHMANGAVVYVTKFDYNLPPVISLAGHYVEGADHTIGTAAGVARISSSMMMLIVL